MPQYFGKVTTKRRDTQTLTPKVLLEDVVEIRNGKNVPFRDHLWVSESQRLDKFTPKDSRNTIAVTFTAKVNKYRGTDGSTKKCLIKIRNIEKA